MSASREMRSELLRATALVTAIGLDLACLLVLGLLIGRLVDSRLGSSPIGLLAGTFLGIGCGLFTAYQMVRRVMRNERA